MRSCQLFANNYKLSWSKKAFLLEQEFFLILKLKFDVVFNNLDYSKFSYTLIYKSHLQKHKTNIDFNDLTYVDKNVFYDSIEFYKKINR
jgi:hypothetical protein